MKKFYFLFLFALIASIGNLYAAEKTVTFDATIDKSSTKTLTKDGITLSLTDGMLGNNSDEDYRTYASNTLTISSKYNITQIVFTCTAEGTTKKGGPGNFKVTQGGALISIAEKLELGQDLRHQSLLKQPQANKFEQKQSKSLTNLKRPNVPLRHSI